MAALDILKSQCTSKPYTSFDNLPLGDYLISSFKLINLKNFGIRLRLDLGDKVVFLPERFSRNFTEQHCAEMNCGQYIFKYLGKDVNNHNKLMVDFVQLPDYDASVYANFN